MITTEPTGATRAEIEGLLARLERELPVGRPVRLLWRDRKNGEASRKPAGAYLIRLPLRPWRPWRATLLHEYAHCLVFDRQDHGGHGEAFVQQLIRVITHVEGDPRRYPWPTEYHAVWRMARARGLTDAPWGRRANHAELAQVVGQRVSFPARVRIGDALVRSRLYGELKRVLRSRAVVAVDWQVPGRHVVGDWTVAVTLVRVEQEATL
jgi:hypothetical protein